MPKEVTAYMMNLLRFYPSPESVPNVIKEDPFDNIFLGLALETESHLIIPGDSHLLDLKDFKKIHIVTPSEAVMVIEEILKDGYT